jgi:hypothetical protein
MNTQRFDAVVRRLGGLHSRRAVVVAALGGVLGVVGLSGPAHEQTAAAPSCRGVGSSCEGNQQCCAGLVCLVSGPGNPRRCTPAPTATRTWTPTPTTTPTTTLSTPTPIP